MSTQTRIESDVDVAGDRGERRKPLRVILPLMAILAMWFIARGAVIGTLANVERITGHFDSNGFSWASPNIDLRPPKSASNGMLSIIGNADHDLDWTVSCEGAPDFHIYVKRGPVRETLPSAASCHDGAVRIHSDWSFVPSATGDSRQLSFQIYEVRVGDEPIRLSDVVSNGKGIYPEEAVRVSSEAGVVLSNLVDAGWYKNIATNGYRYDGNNHVQQDVAWPFLYPYLVKIVARLAPVPIEAVMIKLNAVLMFAAMCALYIIGRMVNLTRWQSLLGPAWLAFNPFSYFLVGGFSEPLFVAIECACLIFLLKRWYYAAAFAVAAMTATRFTGAFAYFWIASLIVTDVTLSRSNRIFALSVTAFVSSLGLIMDMALKLRATGYLLGAFEVRSAWTPSRFGPFRQFLHPFDLLRGEYIYSMIPLYLIAIYGCFCLIKSAHRKVVSTDVLLIGGNIFMTVLSILISGDFHAYGRYFLTFAPATIGITRIEGRSTRFAPIFAIAMSAGAVFMVFNVIRIAIGLPPN